VQWRLVVALSGFGILIGALSIFGLWPLWFEAVEWVVVGVVWVAVLHFRIERRPFLHGLLVGFLGGFGAILLQAMFAPIYLRNNGQIATQYGIDPDHVTLAGRLAILAGGFLVTGVYAVIVGAATSLTRSRPEGPTSDAQGPT